MFYGTAMNLFKSKTKKNVYNYYVLYLQLQNGKISYTVRLM